MKQATLSNRYVIHDLVTYVIIMAIIVTTLIFAYMYDKSTNFFSSLADQVYSDLVK